MGSSKKTQKTEPIYGAQITGAADTLKNVYANNSAGVQSISDQLGGLIPSMLDKYRGGDSSVNAARGFLTNTLESQPDSNPYLDQIVAQTGKNVADKTRTAMGTRGLTGGTAMQDILSRNLAENESGLRYNDYAQAMARKMQAAGMAPSIAAGDAIQIAPLLSVADAATSMPLDAAMKYAAGTGGLLGQYTNTTQKSSGGLLGTIGGILGLAGDAKSLFSDRRLKTDINRVGQTDSGLAIYTYRYGGEGPFHMGVMAQEVAATQPEALGPEVGGYMTVNYAGVR